MIFEYFLDYQILRPFRNLLIMLRIFHQNQALRNKPLYIISDA